MVEALILSRAQEDVSTLVSALEAVEGIDSHQLAGGAKEVAALNFTV